jgi:photosystem II stability/assembly factor-like uncharacterized protein
MKVRWAGTRTSNILADVSFVDTMHGWAVGYDGVTLRTADGGQSWQPLSLPGDGYLASVDFIDQDRGWLTGSDASIYHTTDGGQTWEFQRDDQTLYSNLLDIQFLSATTGWAVGAIGVDGQSLQTTDGGAIWDAMRGDQQAYLDAVDFIDAEHGWAVGQFGAILRSVPSQTTGISGPAIPEGGTGDGGAVPALAVQAGPNPFRAATTFRYRLPAAGQVTLRIYDVTGRSVRTLVDGVESPGARAVAWDGRTDAGQRTGSGIYWYRLDAGARHASGRIVRVR